MIKTKLLYLWLVTCVLFISVSNTFAAAGSSIFYTETGLDGGQWKYDYTFLNTSTTESLYSVYFYFAQETSFTGTSVPTGWEGIVWDGNSWTTSFADTYSTGTSYDIAAGNSLGGFSFTVDHRAGNILYDAFFSGDNVVSGTTAPAAPEPVSSVLYITGGSLLTGIFYLKKRRRT